MYPIDINFLNDRSDYSSATLTKGTYSAPGQSNTPLLLGGAFAGGLVGLVLLAWGGLTFWNQQLVSKEQDLDNQLNRLAPQLKEVDNLAAQEKAVQAETQALAKIFNQIKPWSATLQDLRDRVPRGLQITSIEQVAGAAAPAGGQASPAPSPSPSPNASGTPAPAPAVQDLKLGGNALSFGDVNDFELTLRKSPFLKADQTKLTSSERKVDSQSQTDLINYQLQTQINNVPASELLQILNAKGATGLVTRIESLKKQGVMQP
jgi:type IV pilus assembly protein PilN